MRQPILFLQLILFCGIGFSQNATVLSEQKISDTQGNFLEAMASSDRFGNGAAGLGDLNNDGVEDMVVGSDGWGTGGCVYILFLNTSGTVDSSKRIATGLNGFTGTLNSGDDFGFSVANIGDLDNDGVTDIVVGAEEDDDAGSLAGAIWILFLNSNGTVKAHQKITESQGGFTGNIDGNDRFGHSVTNVGDLDNDGINEIAVGALLDDDGGNGKGAVYVLFMNTNGTVSSHQKISDTQGNFSGVLDDTDNLGSAVAGIGDLNNDGVEDLAASAYLDDDGGTNRGAVYIMFLTTGGSVSSYQKISDTQGGFTGIIGNNEYFGDGEMVNMGDIDGDGITDITVGQNFDGDGGSGKGAVWTLFMNTNGTVKGHQKISQITGGFSTTLDFNDIFGSSIANLGDLDGDGKTDMAVGAPFDDDGGNAKGAMYILFLDGVAQFNASITSQTNPLCVGDCTGSATVTPNGGSSPYTYSWSSGGTTNTETGLCVGTYTVTVTDNSSTSVTTTVTITDPLNPVSANTNVTGNIPCNGSTNGQLTAIGSGGTTPYTYAWSNGGVTAVINGLAANTYTVTITDANGCTDVDTITLTEPPVLNVSLTSTLATCGNNNGTATATASGGTPSYNYSWSNSQTAQTATGLALGTYTVTITDQNGCTVAGNTTVDTVGGPNASIANQTNLLCNGDCDGDAMVTQTGGTSPFTYAWSSGGSTTTETGLCAGTYTVSITDDNNCMDAITVVIAEPAILSTGASVTSNYNGADVSCNGSTDGEATATPTGGTSPYMYSWSSGGSSAIETGIGVGTYTITITDDNSCTTTETVTVTQPTVISGNTTSTQASCGNSDGDATANATGGTPGYTYQWDANANNQTTQTATGLAASNYNVTITDANGCTTVVSANVTNPNAPTASIANQSNVDCFGDCNGEATTTQTGGTSPYSYTWSSSSNTTATETGLCEGTYTVTVNDANNCEGITTVTITEPPAISGSFTSQPATTASECNGEATVTATGGTPGYTYQWDANANNQTTATATGLCIGNYCVTVTDANGCTWDTCGVDVLVGIENLGEIQNGIIVWPNPSNGIFTVKISDFNSQTKLRVIDFTGRTLQELQFTKNTKLINLSNEPAGMYLLQLQVKNQTFHRKLAIE